jgi:subtilisin family serine protease
MKVIVKKYLNVRVGKPSVNAPCYQYLAPGSELEVDGNFYKGDVYDGIDTWLKDLSGNYYWSGGIDNASMSALNLTVVPKQSSAWLKDLEIEDIWNTYGEYGVNATVAILDTGYDINNPDLPKPILTEVFAKSQLGSTSIQDKQGHGTFCTSLIASNNSHISIGIAPYCKLLVGKISLGGEMPDFDVLLDGVEWAVNSGADIVSISMGMPIKNPSTINAIQLRFDQIIRGRNVLVFASCGDSVSGQVITREYYPASLDNCISVGTIKDGHLDNITVRSNKTIVHTLGIEIEGYGLNGANDKKSGTSMSAPIIAGITALGVSYLKNRNDGHWDSAALLTKLIQSGSPVAGLPGKKIADPKHFFELLKDQ